jgi:gamma-glutamyl hercynylcysteine S-oxide synthase
MRTRTELGRSLDEARLRTDELFRCVRPDSLYERPIPERHRILFYVGHVEAFDWNLIARYALDVLAFHPGFDRLFAFGIDPPPGQLPADQPADWPGLAEVERYNRRTRNEIDELVENVPEQLLHVAIEHRLMHAETFAYILHQLPYERKIVPSTGPGAGDWGLGVGWEERGVRAPVMIAIPQGQAQLGLPPDAPFGWDNEFQPHTVEVPAFSIASHKTTNREYLEFVRQGARAPFFWAERGGRWMYRGMFREYPLPMECPVYVTQREAEAYAAWRGRRLPTEAEFHRAACGAKPSANLDFRHWDPIPVHADDLHTGERTGGQSPATPAQMLGNGWEWTSTPFAPFPGFQPFPFYTNYSEPFFDGDHYVIKGASPRTAACFLRPSFRNWFRSSYPYVYGSFRLVEA